MNAECAIGLSAVGAAHGRDLTVLSVESQNAASERGFGTI